ncbi:hypothetical protein ABI59_20260 [Acidobacteria bacterium Mor1]|nr:hypothetical protein ABI59_20260 [Acidobacteria bacterium Mor1]
MTDVSQSCAKHPGVPATLACGRCGMPLCNDCGFDDADGARFCSRSCAGEIRPGGAMRRQRRSDVGQGIVEVAVRLWFRSLGGMLLLSLPIAFAIGVVFPPLARLGEGSDPNEFTRADMAILGLFFVFVFGCSAVGLFLARKHTGEGAGAIWLKALMRFPLLVGTWLLVAVIVVFGYIALIVPGIILAMRLFWADELVLVHGRNPLAAIRESWDLTRGITLHVFIFQFVLGLSVYLLMIPFAILWFGGAVAWMMFGSAFGSGGFGEFLSAFWGAICLIAFYGLIHAFEVVKFYSLRERRAELTVEQAKRGGWA